MPLWPVRTPWRPIALSCGIKESMRPPSTASCGLSAIPGSAVPRISPEGQPTEADIAARIRAERKDPRPGILAVERKGAGDVIGYCGLVFQGNGSPDEPELAYELLRAAHGCGYATEAGRAVVTWVSEAGYGRLWATVRDWNVASRRVLEKLGFRETGRVEHDVVHGDSLLTIREF